MENVLLIGGAGYIGGQTCDRLIDNGFNVTVYDNLLYEGRYFKKVKFIYGDIRETERILTIAKSYDTIVMMAALVGDKACDVCRTLTEEINFRSVADLCLMLPSDKHVIFISTCSVYGKQDGLLNEESPVNPLSLYAETKLDAEKYVLERKGTVLRLGTVFGVGDTYNRLRLDLVINTLVMRACKFKEITISGGDQWRPVIAVNDVADYIVECCQKKSEGIYILSKENITMKEIGEKVAAILKANLLFKDLPDTDKRNYKVDNSKALRNFNHVPRISITVEILKIAAIINEGRIKNCNDVVYNNGAFISSKIK